MIALELEIDYPDEATARAVMVSLEPENAGNVASEFWVQTSFLSFPQPTEVMRRRPYWLHKFPRKQSDSIGLIRDKEELF